MVHRRASDSRENPLRRQGIPPLGRRAPDAVKGAPPRAHWRACWPSDFFTTEVWTESAALWSTYSKRKGMEPGALIIKQHVTRLVSGSAQVGDPVRVTVRGGRGRGPHRGRRVLHTIGLNRRPYGPCTNSRHQREAAGPVAGFTEFCDFHSIAGRHRLRHLPLPLSSSSCWTFTSRSAMVNCPLRFLSVLFLATANRTVPLPVPLAPPVMPIHDSPELAVHAQPLIVDTLMVPVPPAASIFTLSGEIEYLHVGAGGVGVGAGGVGVGAGGVGVGAGGVGAGGVGVGAGGVGVGDGAGGVGVGAGGVGVGAGGVGAGGVGVGDGAGGGGVGAGGVGAGGVGDGGLAAAPAAPQLLPA